MERIQIQVERITHRTTRVRIWSGGMVSGRCALDVRGYGVAHTVQMAVYEYRLRRNMIERRLSEVGGY